MHYINSSDLCKCIILFYFIFYLFFISKQNINRESDQLVFDIEDLERWRDRIFNAIHSGFIINVIIYIHT